MLFWDWLTLIDIITIIINTFLKKKIKKMIKMLLPQIQTEQLLINMLKQLLKLLLLNTQVNPIEHQPINLPWISNTKTLLIRMPPLELNTILKMLKTMLLIDNGSPKTIDLTGLRLNPQILTELFLMELLLRKLVLLLKKNLKKLQMRPLFLNLKLMPLLPPLLKRTELLPEE